MGDLTTEEQNKIDAIRAQNPGTGFKKLLSLIRAECPGIQKQLVKNVLAIPPSESPEPVHLRQSVQSPAIKPEPKIPATPYKIVEISGKGKGMVAARNIKAGELVIAEAPAISVLQHGSSINYMDLLQELDALPPEKLVKFLELHNAQKGRMPAMVDIFCTNCIEMGSTNRLGLFFICSNFNSTCMPNVNNTWYQNLGKVLFHAVRDIKCGEELGFCYVSILDSRKERRSLLQDRYGFECHCAACVAAPELLEISEARRSRIAAIEKILDDKDKKAMSNARQNLKLIDESFGLMSQEKLFAWVPSLAKTGYQLAFETGQLEKAKMWAKRTYDYACLVHGEDCDWIQPFKGYADKPERYLEGTDAIAVGMMKAMGWSERQINATLASGGMF